MFWRIRTGSKASAVDTEKNPEALGSLDYSKQLGRPGYLGKAATVRHAAKEAIKAGEHDKAWGLLHKEQEYYARHAAKNGWSNTRLLTLTGRIHESFANILRKEKKHHQALEHILFWIKSDRRPIQYRATKRHESKLRSYLNRCQFEGISIDEAMEYAKANDGLADLRNIRTKVSEWRRRSVRTNKLHIDNLQQGIDSET